MLISAYILIQLQERAHLIQIYSVAIHSLYNQLPSLNYIQSNRQYYTYFKLSHILQADRITHTSSQLQEMKLFPTEFEDQTFYPLTHEMSLLINNICQRLNTRIDLCHVALFIFHAHFKIVTFHRFDRFIFSCASVLIATKLTQNGRYPLDIIKAMRSLLRQKKKVSTCEQDCAERLNLLLKKTIEAEIKILISIGFDLQIEVALYWVNQWRNKIKDNHLVKRIEDQLTLLYYTNIVVYYRPIQLALTSLMMVLKKQEIALSLCDWDKQFIDFVEQSSQMVPEIIQEYNLRKQHLHKK